MASSRKRQLATLSFGLCGLGGSLLLIDPERADHHPRVSDPHVDTQKLMLHVVLLQATC